MHLRRKKTSLAQSVIDGLPDAAKRHELAEQATDVATRVARAVTEEGHALMEHHGKNISPKGKRPRRHRLRKVVLLAGAGGAAAYFLDPKAGNQRRAAAKRRTSTSAQVVGDGLDRAAHVAHQAAAVTATDPQVDDLRRSTAKA